MSYTSYETPEPVTITPDTPLEPPVDSVEHKFRIIHEVYLNGAKEPASTWTTAVHDSEFFATWVEAHEPELLPLLSVLSHLL